MDGLDILHEDSDCLVVAKPAGLLTQAPLGIDSLEFRIKRFLRERGDNLGEIYLGVPHRLDRPVSGVIVFAKHIKAARKISRQFERRQVEKTYWALVAGNVDSPAGTWTDLVKKIEGEPRTIVVEAGDPDGRMAVLHYRVVEKMPGRTLLEIQLETGRTHQIRVQCSSRGHPLWGDSLYGSNQSFGPWSADERERLIALHARRLRLLHPTTREYIDIVAPLPEVWREAGVEGRMNQESKDQRTKGDE
jgi:RluA family pseudouridine synthase